MILVFLVLWIIFALLLMGEGKFVRMIIYLSVFSLISSLCFFLFGAPDVALAEAVISVFSTIIFIVSFEKYYGNTDQSSGNNNPPSVKKHILAALMALFLFILFIAFAPGDTANPGLKAKYLSDFANEIGGRNSVTAIYLGYRLYDTLFESLMLLISMSAVIHLSWYEYFFASQELYIGLKHSQIAVYTIRIICQILILVSFYIMINGHLSPGGGFQGGVIAASFFICRYMIFDMFDIPIGKVIKLEKVFYIGIVFVALSFVSMAAKISLPQYKAVYLIFMNLLIGMKVACGFFILFFRFIAFERR